MKPSSGTILISDPFLRDPNFARSIVLLAEHNEAGSFGFVLNNAIDLTINVALKDDTLPESVIFQGGPVQVDTLHFIHSLGANIIEESKEIMPDVYWGGDFKKAFDILRKSPELANRFVFFAGYSGWGPHQLEDELEEEAWIVSTIGSAMVFNANIDSTELWKKAMRRLGGKYAMLVDSPIDPGLN